MKNILSNHNSAGLTSLLLALPFPTLILLFMLGFEPRLGTLPELLGTSESRLGSLIGLGAFLLLVVAFILSLASIRRDARAGRGIAASPLNLFLAATTLILIVAFVGAIVVDQYPCWIGVPNCD